MQKNSQVDARGGNRGLKGGQGRFAFPNGWGGRRRGAGRKPRGERAAISHDTRSPVAARFPVAVTMRVRTGLPSLRGLRAHTAVRAAIIRGSERAGFRLVHYSAQTNHLHLIVEGSSRLEVSRGLQGLAIRMARALNRLWRRRGSLFVDRYHDRILRSPREVWNALRYVLCNARKHGSWNSSVHGDPCSSAAWFDGWRGFISKLAAPRPTAPAQTWLLNQGWRRHGLIPVDAIPTRLERRGRSAPLRST